MAKRLLGLTASALVLGWSATASLAEDRVVNVYNWSDYIDASILEDFTKETGIKVVYDVFDSNEVLETKLLAGNSGYDVVVPTANFLQRQITAGVFQPLDKSKLPNWSNTWDMINQRTDAYDPGNQYAFTYMWGTVGIGYNVDKVEAVLGKDVKPSWATIFKPENISKFADCGVYMLDSATDILPTVLNYLGIDHRSKSPDDLAKAEEVMMAIRPHIRKFHSSEYINALANGDICIAIGWSGDVFQARARADEAKAGVKVNYVVPEEGAEMWFDMMAIPADAPHPEEAHAFLNYMLKPEVAAKASNYVYYANGNAASKPLLNKDIIDDPAIYPPEDVMAKLFTVQAYDPKTQRTVTRIWTRIVTGQ